MWRRYPELEHFKSRRERHTALSRADKATRFGRHRLLYTMLIAVFAPLTPSGIPYLGGPDLSQDQAFFVFIVVLGVSLILVGLSNKKQIRRNLRQQLSDRRQAICVPCGYNLTGNESGICPECGTGVET